MPRPTSSKNNRTANTSWANVSNVFEGKVDTWNRKGDLVAIRGNDTPLDAIALAHARPGSRIIDLGGGTGKTIRKLINKVGKGHLVLADLSRRMVIEAEADFRTAVRTRYTVCVADACCTPFPTDWADQTHARQLLQHVPSPAKVIEEAARITKPGGLVLVQVPGPAYLGSLARFSSHELDPIGRFSTAELTELFTTASLRVEVSSHRFSIGLRGLAGALRFFAAVSLLDKLAGYLPTTTEVVRRLLAQDVINKLLDGPRRTTISIPGEYLVAVGRKN
jgi:ubiquinone/menaquinone biosynthesis C-methylase UbiE